MRFFFYGSLMDAAVRDIVFGMPTVANAAVLAGWSRVAIAGDSFPVIVPEVGNAVSGVLVEVPDGDPVARLRYFEDLDYRVDTMTVTCGDGTRVAAQVCVDTGIVLRTSTPWSFARWQAEERAVFLEIARAFMAQFGLVAIEDADALWRRLKAEIAARHAAALATQDRRRVGT